jgi:hypothetical protein
MWAFSLTSGRVCRLQFLLDLASAVILGSYCLRFETSLFVAFYDSQGHGGGIRPRLQTGIHTHSLSLSLNIANIVTCQTLGEMSTP